MRVNTTLFSLLLLLPLALTIQASENQRPENQASVKQTKKIRSAVSSLADKTAHYAVKTYKKQMIDSLEKLVRYNTVAKEGIPSPENPEHIAFKEELSRQAKLLGFDFHDYGYVMIIGLGDSKERIGVITHGDVQPADPSKWKQSPFKLDLTSEPGKLIGRGTEDDKGPISSALYAMKSIKDQNIKLSKRIELYIYMAEESDWDPLKKFIKKHTLPQLNITLDAAYPVVTAEKGYGTISMIFPQKKLVTDKTYVQSFKGGFFNSQIPEDAQAIIINADKNLLSQLRSAAAAHQGMKYTYQLSGKQLTITARGKSTHSSKPENGVNAITHLADLLSTKRWPSNSAGALVNFLNDHLGTGLYGKKFGNIAYKDDFMGPMSVSPTLLKQTDKGIQLNINLRRPRGKLKSQLENEIKFALAAWESSNQIKLTGLSFYIGEPFVLSDAPHISTLLNVFSHYTNIYPAHPVSIGGGTNSRLFPNAVSFGPSMPDAEYTGHSEHEFISMKQFELNLKMYTAALVELAK